MPKPYEVKRKRQLGVALVALLCLAVVLPGCGRREPARAGGTAKPKPATTAGAEPTSIPVRPRSLSFTQSGMHNCGTVAMLISWAHTRPKQAGNLVHRQADGSYLVSTGTGSEVIVTAADLAAAAKTSLVRCSADDPWAAIVLTAFVKSRSKKGRLDFGIIECIYAGEIAKFASGARTGVFEIKPEKISRNGAISVGKPIPLKRLNEALTNLAGYPMVAYTNRRVHIWAVLDYDSVLSRVLVRNPRSTASEWLNLAEFSSRFQLVVVSCS